jgi:16S rRNA (guanine527-N7)-methyltransferase
MSPPGRPKGESLSAQRAGGPLSPPGRPKGESLSAQRAGGPLPPPGRYRGARRPPGVTPVDPRPAAAPAAAFAF